MNGSHLAIGAVAALALVSAFGGHGSRSEPGLEGRVGRCPIFDQGAGESDEAFVVRLLELSKSSNAPVCGRDRLDRVFPVDPSLDLQGAIKLRNTLVGLSPRFPRNQDSLEIVTSKVLDGTGHPFGVFGAWLIHDQMPESEDYAILAEHRGVYYLVTKDDDMTSLTKRFHGTLSARA
jgi:hypothetical protein